MSSENTLKTLFTIVLALNAVTLAQPLMATSFTIADGEVVNTQQNLGDYETGTIEMGGELNVGSGISINVTGINASIENAGVISATGIGVVGIQSSGSGTTITNAGSIISESGLGVYVIEDAADISNSGSIKTTGDFGRGILSLGSNTAVTHSGSILTTGIAADAVFLQGDSVNVFSSGNITTQGSLSSGILSSGDNVIISHSGTLITNGFYAYGIVSDGDNVTIDNRGNILTTSVGADAIKLDGINADLSNSGSISTIGQQADGVFSRVDNASIANAGSITTSGFVAHGIWSLGDAAKLTNSGNISISGNNSNGIMAFGEDLVLTNSGSISIAGYGGFGVELFGDNAILANGGRITTSGDYGRGIRLDGKDITVYNSGLISTTEFSSEGILSEGADIAIANKGSISTVGDFSHGIRSTAENATITNTGSISTQGGIAHGIYAVGANTTINNSGLISATGSTSAPVPYRGVSFLVGPSSSAAILGSSNDITLNLLPGSQILGRIDLGGDGTDLDTVNIYGNGGASSSTSLTFENTEVVNLFGVNGFLVGDSVVTVDATGESTRGVSLAKVTSAIHNVINQRMAHTTPLAPSQVASRSLAPGMLFRERKPVAWIQAFGGESERDSEGSALEYEHDYQGVSLGYEMDYEGNRLGLMGGVVRSETETDIGSFETEADSYYLGGYGHFDLGAVNFTATLLGGYSDYDNKRIVWDNLNGREAAKSDFDGLFLSPSVTLSAAYAMNNHLELRPSASLNYSVAWLDSYSERGTTSSNLKIDDRTVRALSARMQLGVAYKFSQCSEVEFRVGMDSRHTDDDDIDVNLAGSNFRYATAGDEDVTGGYAGLNVRFTSSKNLSLIADIELGEASGAEDSTSGHLTLEYRF